MSSRNYIKHSVSSTPPADSKLGDEYFNPSTGLLYKSIAVGGNTVGYQQVPVAVNGAVNLAANVAITGTLTVNGSSIITTDVSNNLVLTGITASTSTTTGALQVAGGVGIGGDLYVGGGLYVTGTITATNLTLNSIFVSLGLNANASTSNGIAIGWHPNGMSGQGSNSIAIGTSAGNTNQGINSIAMGFGAAYNGQNNGIAIGYRSGGLGGGPQGAGAVALGYQAAYGVQGDYSVAIGYNSAYYNQASGSIIISATGTNYIGTATNQGLYITPIRADATLSATSVAVYYNPDTRELTTSTAGTSGGSTTITNDTAGSTTYYPQMTTATTGILTSSTVSTTKLYFVPSTGTLNATVFQSLSDERQKANISVISNGLEIVEGLRGVTFDWADGSGSSAGLLAQEVEQWLPQLVNTGPDGVKNLNYSGVIGALVEAVKTLSDRVKILESK